MPLLDLQGLPLTANIAIFAAAAVVVWFAGTALTRQLDTIAGRAGLSRVFVGMLLLGGITSLPEVANVITASAMDNPRLAINNLLGSAAINVLLLAVADAFIGRDAVTSVVTKPSTMMMATLCILVLVGIAVATVTGDVAVPGIGIGVGSLLIAATSIGFFWLATGYDRRSPWTLKDEPDEEAEADAEERGPYSSLIIKASVSGALIFVAGYTLSVTGDAIAAQAGIDSGMVGFALIGLATSLPELSSIVTALKLHRYEMAFGQVLGTNFINLSLILLGDGVFAGGPVINELGRFETVSALLGATFIGIFIVGLLERRDATILRMGYDSFAVIMLFMAGLGLLAGIG